MKNLMASLVAVVALAGASLINPGPSFAQEIDHARFMGEFAQFVQGRLAAERDIREKLDKLIDENRKAVSEDFGMHPELMPKIYAVAGIEKLECLSGRYFITFQKDLTNEERMAFYETKHSMDRWVFNLALEEAVKLKVLEPSPPLNYRFKDDVPYTLAETMRLATKPYLGMKPGKEAGKGYGFDDIECK